jgi:hypothetical protein
MIQKIRVTKAITDRQEIDRILRKGREPGTSLYKVGINKRARKHRIHGMIHPVVRIPKGGEFGTARFVYWLDNVAPWCMKGGTVKPDNIVMFDVDAGSSYQEFVDLASEYPTMHDGYIRPSEFKKIMGSTNMLVGIE